MKTLCYIYVGIAIPLTIIIPGVPAIARYRSLPTELRIICWYLLLSGIANVVNNLLGFNHINNMPVGHAYTALEFTFLCMFYRQAMGNTRIGQYLLLIAGIFVAFCVANAIFFQEIERFNSYTKTIEALAIIFFAIAYFKVILDRSGSTNIKDGAASYINAGVLIYFSGSLIFFAIQNIHLPSSDFWQVLWMAHASLLFIMYQLFALALWRYNQ